MRICELHVSNANYEMFGSGTYINNDKTIELGCYCHVGNWQDSVIVGHRTDLGFKDDFVRYYPHGYHNQEGNRIEFYGIYVDFVKVYNDTGKGLIVDEDYVEPGDVWIYDKRDKTKTPRERLNYSLQDFKDNGKKCLVCGSHKTYGVIGLLKNSFDLDIIYYKCTDCGKRYSFKEEEGKDE